MQYNRGAHLVALRIVVLPVQAARSPSLQLVVSCTTVSSIHGSLGKRGHVPARILHCTALVAAAVVVDYSHHSLVVVKVLREEVDSLNNPGACLHISKWASEVVLV